ncbi:MAG: cysteine--tRNA ligase [Anaerolineales bacterium]|jgi:cysteinyl-tRNA synthetase|uniref:cysteine--tRNA ligase n=1 Tax=Candidatus Villigracilis vicinus TaxID=3140679 RepID=UPI003135CAAE|nr:cysteine--tRNA ligase [Anaerolineales bacterium]MBK9779582.1 cysteine--tRNA ligase [Anaerolineales bacterium]
MLKIYNTLTRKTEEFQTLEPNLVKMYVCGVTVYNDAHVGHAMSAIVFDIVRRYLEYRGYAVKHVMNYTDVDDKIINRANQLGEDPLKLSARYIADYAADLKSLNVLPATSNPQVSTTMPLIIQFIEGLIQKGHAYAAENGDVYFRVNSDDDYGRLSGRKLEDMQAGARIEIGEQKEHPMDFALWKAAKPGEISWDSPWGKGRPGWHIECSAMNLAELGEQIDIHGGGNDLIFPHHENEIAQSESYTGKEFSRYWIHNGMLQLGGEKMSKSLGNIISIKEFLSKRSSDVMRMLVLNGTYRAPLMFNDETLDAAERNVERLKSALKPASPSASGLSADTLSASIESANANFTEAMDNDFNTAGAVAALFELSKAINTARDNGANTDQLKPAQETFKQLAGVLGLKLEEKKGSSEKEAEVETLLAERTQARKDKNWKRSDEIRDQLKAMGVTIEDSKDGTTWKWS